MRFQRKADKPKWLYWLTFAIFIVVIGSMTLWLLHSAARITFGQVEEKAKYSSHDATFWADESNYDLNDEFSPYTWVDGRVTDVSEMKEYDYALVEVQSRGKTYNMILSMKDINLNVGDHVRAYGIVMFASDPKSCGLGSSEETTPSLITQEVQVFWM